MSYARAFERNWPDATAFGNLPDFRPLVKAALEFGIFEYLEENGRANVDEIAKAQNISHRGTEAIVMACANKGFLEASAGCFSNAPVTSAFLDWKDLWNTLLQTNYEQLFNDLEGQLRNGKPNKGIEGWSPIGGLEEARAFYGSPRVHEWRIRRGRSLARAMNLESFHCVMDVGGAGGEHTISIIEAYPDLEAMIYDLPIACEVAKERIAEAGYTEKIKTYPGNFLEEEFPSGPDVILMAFVLHDWGLDEDRMLIEKAYRALPSGGILIIEEYFMNDEKTAPTSGIQQALMVLAGSTGGWQPSYLEMQELLSEGGFDQVEAIRDTDPFGQGFVIGIKP